MNISFANLEQFYNKWNTFSPDEFILSKRVDDIVTKISITLKSAFQQIADVSKEMQQNNAIQSNFNKIFTSQVSDVTNLLSGTKENIDLLNKKIEILERQIEQIRSGLKFCSDTIQNV